MKTTSMRLKRLKPVSAFFAAALVSAAMALTLQAKDTSPLDLARELNEAFVQAAENVSPAVVVIRVAHKPSSIDLDDEASPFWDMVPRQFRKQLEEQRERKRKDEPKRQHPEGEEPVFDAQGSGIVLREEGYILTNRHVVDEAEKIKVRFKDSFDEYDAEIRGVDAQSDLAVIKINPKGRKLTAAKLGDSDKARVGEFAIAIGAPFELDYSVTFGHVSAKGRTQILSDRTMDQDFIQTDASINPGNSGGPLININGEVIGINTLIRGMHTGVGFAIPVNFAREVAEKLIADGKFIRSWLGVQIHQLRRDPQLLELVKGVADGVVVDSIVGVGPAAKSDLKPADIIIAVDGKAVRTPQELKNEVRTKKVGQSVILDVHRLDESQHGKTIKVKLNTGAWPEDPMPVVAKRETPKEEETKNLGLTVKAITKELAEQYGVQKTEGVIITDVEAGSHAERKGLRPGDIITEINHKPIASPKQFREALKTSDPKKLFVINFISGGTSRFEVLRESGE
ncbi:MAG TPA: trypsin-like peptidase domain-containing protein [Verrucomicrobiae bacterium]